MSSYLFIPISLRCTMVSTRLRNIAFSFGYLLKSSYILCCLLLSSYIIYCPFIFFLSFSDLFLILFSHFIILFFHYESPRLWWRDASNSGYWYGCLFYVHGHSRNVTFSWTTLSSLLLVLFLMSQYVSSPINFVGSDMLFFRFFWDYAQISNNQTYRSLHGDGQ